jgi:hypothetical protein
VAVTHPESLCIYTNVELSMAMENKWRNQVDVEILAD